MKPNLFPQNQSAFAQPLESDFSSATEATGDSAEYSAWRVGPYEIRDKIGQGGMATVYRAWHLHLHRFEALKIPRRENGVDSEYIPRLLAEARTAARLFHPHIVAIHNISEDGADHPYFSMDLVEGSDLSQLLKERGPLPLGEIVEIVRQTAGGIAHAHQHHVVHRDIKPENILLQPLGDGQWQVKVVDFGISRAAEDQEGTRLTRSGMMVGTPEYMSPEQSGSGAAVDYRTDIYSLGIVAYEMLTGAPPFSVGEDVSRMAILISHARDLPRSPHEVNPAISSEVSDVIMRALAKNPDERFQAAEEFADALKKAAQPLNAASCALPEYSRCGPIIQKSKRSWAAMAGAVTIGVLIGWLASTIPHRSVVATASDLPAKSKVQARVQTKPQANAKNVKSLPVRIQQPVTRRRTLQRAIAFEKTTRRSTALSRGRRKITQKGANGLREIVLQISTREGEELSRRQISTRVLRAPVAQFEMVGTRKPVARQASIRKVSIRKVPVRKAQRTRRSAARLSAFNPTPTASTPKRRTPSRPRYPRPAVTPRASSNKNPTKRVSVARENKPSKRSKIMRVPSDQVLGSFRVPSSHNR